MTWGYNNSNLGNGVTYRQTVLNPSNIAHLAPGADGKISVGMGFAVETQQVPIPVPTLPGASDWTDSSFNMYSELHSKALKMREQFGPGSTEYANAYDDVRSFLAPYAPANFVADGVTLTGQDVQVPFPLNKVSTEDLVTAGLQPGAHTMIQTYSPSWDGESTNENIWAQLQPNPSQGETPQPELYQTRTIYDWQAKDLAFNRVDLGARQAITALFYVPLSPIQGDSSLDQTTYSISIKLLYESTLHDLTPGDLYHTVLENLNAQELDQGTLVPSEFPENIGVGKNAGMIYSAVHPIRWGFDLHTDGNTALGHDTGASTDRRHPVQTSSEFRLESTLHNGVMRQSLFKHGSPDTGASNFIFTEGYPRHYVTSTSVDYYWNDGDGDSTLTRKYNFVAPISSTLQLYQPNNSDYPIAIGPIRGISNGEFTVARIDVDEDIVTMNFQGNIGKHAYHQSRSSHMVNDDSIAGTDNTNLISDRHQCELIPIEVGWYVRDMSGATLPPFRLVIEYV